MSQVGQAAVFAIDDYDVTVGLAESQSPPIWRPIYADDMNCVRVHGGKNPPVNVQDG